MSPPRCTYRNAHVEKLSSRLLGVGGFRGRFFDVVQRNFFPTIALVLWHGIRLRLRRRRLLRAHLEKSERHFVFCIRHVASFEGMLEVGQFPFVLKFVCVFPEIIWSAFFACIPSPPRWRPRRRRRRPTSSSQSRSSSEEEEEASLLSSPITANTIDADAVLLLSALNQINAQLLFRADFQLISEMSGWI